MCESLSESNYGGDYIAHESLKSLVNQYTDLVKNLLILFIIILYYDILITRFSYLKQTLSIFSNLL